MKITDLISLSVLMAFIFFLGSLIARQSRQEREEIVKAVEKRKIDEQIVKNKEIEEFAFVNKAYELLPDYQAAIRLLKQRYSWISLVKSIQLNSLELELLREVTLNREISLPNMNKSKYGQDEQRVLNRAIELSRPFEEDFHIVSDNYQEPTLEDLEKLESHGYVKIYKIIDSNTFSVELTKNGKKLYTLDREFRDHYEDFRNSLENLKSKDGIKVIAKIINSIF